MALKAILDSLEGIDQTVAGHYTERDGKFHLGIEGLQAQAPDPTKYAPRAELAAASEKAKAANEALKAVADELIEDVPEDMRGLVPDLAPAEKIKWLRNALRQGIFTKSAADDNGPDAKRPGASKKADFTNMDPRAIMATGYKTK